jgi:hypothetical protein
LSHVFEGKGHSLTIDDGRKDVASTHTTFPDDRGLPLSSPNAWADAADHHHVATGIDRQACRAPLTANSALRSTKSCGSVIDVSTANTARARRHAMEVEW